MQHDWEKDDYIWNISGKIKRKKRSIGRSRRKWANDNRMESSERENVVRIGLLWLRTGIWVRFL
jgi:hypothetical protein